MITNVTTYPPKALAWHDALGPRPVEMVVEHEQPSMDILRGLMKFRRFSD